MRFPMVLGPKGTRSMLSTGHFVAFPAENYCQPFRRTEWHISSL
jgi:hypothetical protein